MSLKTDKQLLLPGNISPDLLTALRRFVDTVWQDLDMLDRRSAGSVGSAKNFQVFTASGSWTPPAGVTRILVEAWGSGGGGSGSSDVGGGSGGGAGGYILASLDVTAAVNIAIGTAGDGGQAPNGNGTAGLNTVVSGNGWELTASGGAGGTSTAAGVGGGTTVNGAVASFGIVGGDGAKLPSGDFGGWPGGASPQGGSGGRHTSGIETAQPGKVPGGGGSGAPGSIAPVGQVGGNGALGRVVIWW